MNDALEQRAQLHLLNQLIRERALIQRRCRAGLTAADPDTDRPCRLTHYQAAVDTLRSLDAISSAEARAWQRHFEWVEPEAEGLVPDPETHGRAEGFLGELFAEQLAGEAAVERRAVSFARSAWALEHVGAISEEEVRDWIDRVHAELGLPTPTEKAERERAQSCTALDLRGVVAAPMAVGDLQVSHLELYADGALLYSRESGGATCGADPSSPAPFSDQEDASLLSVGDDLGTVYDPRRDHGFAKALTPAIPETASRLEISYGHAVGEISLR